MRAPIADASRQFKLEIKTSPISSTIANKADRAHESRQMSVSACVIVLMLPAILSVATGVAPTVDPEDRRAEIEMGDPAEYLGFGAVVHNDFEFEIFVFHVRILADRGRVVP